MLLETITLNHRNRIEELRKRHRHHSSSHAFSSLFMWQEEMCLKLYLEKDMFAVRCKSRGENCWFFPCGTRDAVISFIRQLLNDSKKPLRFCYMRKEDARLIRNEFPDLFILHSAPQDDEYLYDKDEQILLSGRKFRHQRNSLNRLKKKYQVETHTISPENLEYAALVLERAGKRSKLCSEGFSSESAEKCILNNWDNLSANGIIVYADGQPAAVAAGYMISDDIYDISICRQSVEDPDIAVYARHQLFQNIPESVKTINAEEDLGFEGLRNLKRGMNNTGLLKMFEGVSKCQDTTQQI